MKKIFSTIAVLIIAAGIVFYITEYERTDKQGGESNQESTGWQTYANKAFGYSISYPKDQFILNEVNNPVVESPTRDIGELELKPEFWIEYSDLVGPTRNPKIFWIVNKDTESINDECVRYSENPNQAMQLISDKRFIVGEAVSSNDIGEGGTYLKDYIHKSNDRCFLIEANIAVQSYEDNVPTVNPRLQTLLARLENIVISFEIQK